MMRAWIGRALCAAGVWVATAMPSLAQTPAGVGIPPQAQIINEAMSKAWQEQKLTPSERATDDEFIRRVFLDVIGRTPSPEEIRDYERDKAPNKRAKLVHRLLNAEAYKIKDAFGKDILGDDKKPIVFEYTREFAEHWANVWTVWLMSRTGVHEVYHDNVHFWLKKQFFSNTPYDQFVRELLTATGKSNDNGAAAFVMAHLGDKNPADKRITDGPFDAVPITSRVTRLFLGIQTQCTQCHDHPFNPEWGQENFWGVNAFFRQVTRSSDPPMFVAAGQKAKKGMDAVPITISDDPKLNDNGRIFYERRSGLLMSIKPSFLPNLADLDKDKADRTKKVLGTDAKKTRRESLSEFVTSHDNFGKAYINRLWGHFFGRGLNEQATIDDFGGHNKLVHPEMLEKLAAEFGSSQYKYDVKQLMFWICTSDPYNLSYKANASNAKDEVLPYFSRMPLKSMSPEVLFESLATATRIDAAGNKESRKEAREKWMDKLVVQFGDDEGNEMTFNGTIVQALLMMNGKELNEEIKRTDGTVVKAIARANALKTGDKDMAIVEELYMSSLGRRPSAKVMLETTRPAIDPKTKKEIPGKTVKVSAISEIDFVRQAIAKAKATADPKKGIQPFYEDLFWGLLNSNEFILNH